ncbi:MAG: ribonuclease H-like domain-containing protein [Myxococcota bacterium]
MSLARRLAHRADAGEPKKKKLRKPPLRKPPLRNKAARTRPTGQEGFVRDAVDVPVGARQRRPAAVAKDLAGLELPTAPALADALADLAVMPRAGLDPEVPAVMIDLETTGLMGQSGALVCVVGAAWHVAPDCLHFEQWSLHRVGAEGAMLADIDATLRDRVGPRTSFVSFNGASFDLPLLRRRMIRHAIYRATEDPLRAPHVDLLHPARRLWRDRGPDCRLGTLEARQLAMHREGDVGGAEVVELLWRWLEEPDEAAAADLAKVQRHNRIDVLSLTALAHTMHRRLADPVDDVERLRAARHHHRLERMPAAVALLEPLLARLARSTTPGKGWETPVGAGLLAAEIERRAGRHDLAARYWAQVCRRVPGHPEAHEALAKHLEHKARAPAAALAVASASVTPCERRVARLRKKVADGPVPPVVEVVSTWAQPRV